MEMESKWKSKVQIESECASYDISLCALNNLMVPFFLSLFSVFSHFLDFHREREKNITCVILAVLGQHSIFFLPRRNGIPRVVSNNSCFDLLLLKNLLCLEHNLLPKITRNAVFLLFGRCCCFFREKSKHFEAVLSVCTFLFLTSAHSACVCVCGWECEWSIKLISTTLMVD